jgi:hypothetical protein
MHPVRARTIIPLMRLFIQGGGNVLTIEYQDRNWEEIGGQAQVNTP